MKKGKDEKKISKWREALFDGIGEIVLTLIFLGVGLAVFALLGLDFDWENTDPDILILVGIAVIALAAGIAFAVYSIFKRRKAKGSRSANSEKEPGVSNTDKEENN